MNKTKSAILSALAMASPLVAAPAMASHWEVWSASGWSQSGTSIFHGPTTASVVGNPIPCSNATFTMSVSGGVATVIAATFSGSAACTAIKVNNLPWSVAAPVAIAGSTSVSTTIGGINIVIGTPPTTCTGSVGGVVSNANPNNSGVTPPTANNFTFAGSLAGGCGVSSNTTLTNSGSPAPSQFVRAVFP